MLPPPPIPARRNIHSPPTSTSAGQTGHVDETSSKSRSAPSSPTVAAGRESPGVQGHRLSPDGSPGRPHSVMLDSGRVQAGAVESDRVQYTTVAFTDAGPHHPPPARRNTAYTDIQHPPAKPLTIKEQGELPGQTPEGEEEEVGRPVSPSYVSVGVCSPRLQASGGAACADKAEEALYDVPPPPVPVRFTSQEATHETPPITPPTPVARPTATEPSNQPPAGPSLEDPFNSQFSDPFFESAWNDPSAFYDQPRSMLATQPAAPVPDEDGYLEIGSVVSSATIASSITASTADCTGDSSYEDTSSFLLDIRARYKNRMSEDLLPRQQPHEADSTTTMYDLPPPEQDTAKQGAVVPSLPPVEEVAHLGSYDFPTALNRFPFGDGEEERKREEPPLHPIQYPVQKPSPPAQHGGGAAEGAAAPSAVATVSRSESTTRGSRANVPLPPTPVEQNTRGLESSGHGLEDPPPLPARQGGPLLKSLASREGPLIPLADRPRLPPMNHPWGNKKQLENRKQHENKMQQELHNPPLPPRNKAGTNGHPQAEATPPTQPQEDPAMLELMNRGYQKADIESALRIAKNDYELAKSILKEFGGRH